MNNNVKKNWRIILNLSTLQGSNRTFERNCTRSQLQGVVSKYVAKHHLAPHQVYFQEIN